MSAPVCSTAVRAPRAVELIGAPSDCGANLAGANLSGASLVNVTLDGAVTTGAIWTNGRRR